MKAIALKNYGGPEALQLEEIATPVYAADQVLVEIRAAGANHLDIGKAVGAFRKMFELPFPWIPGIDFSGVVKNVGDQVKGFKPGDEVYGTSLQGGTFAEYIAVSPAVMALKPHTLDFTEAASVPVSGETAWQVLFDRAKIIKGQTILIHGAAGAVGTYAVQLAHQAGARVITTASGADADFLTSLGADQVLDYKAVPFESVVSQVDAVIDFVGGEVQQRSYPVIKEGGILISVNQPTSDELTAKYKVRAIFSQLQPSQEGLTRLAEKIDAGALKINIGEVYPLEQAAQAWKILLAKHPVKNGRIVLKIK